jgi:hypothetical protein
MAQRRVALLAFGDAERQLGRQLPHLLTSNSAVI